MSQLLRYVILTCLLLNTTVFAQQREANIWYFGRYLGLDFNSGTAVPINDGQLNTTEGVATISDANGNLLFYTDGIKIWNHLHQLMPNGSGLFGNVSSTQSAVIVPKIGDPLRYYVFTVDATSGPRGLTYSVVNMTLDGGNGDVELKNITLQLNVVEKITAVRHCNNRDIWVMAHGSASDIYYSFLVTQTGISTTPVISHSGSVLPGLVPPSLIDSSSLGYLKASPNGKKIVAAHWTVGTEVSDFNNATGIVTNTIGLFVPSEGYRLPYGVEFSPNSSLVYTTVFYTDPANAVKRNALLQYDVSLGTAAAIRASKQIISQTSDPIQVYAALQVAPDNKMYMAKNIYKHVACINNPDIYGTGCNFTANAIQYTLPNQESSFGLPTFVQSYFYPADSFTHTVSCQTMTGNFNYNPAANVLTVRWDFGDPSSGVNNSSTQNNTQHIFTSPGTYTVRLIKFTNCGTDTISRQVTTDAININLGPDTTVCTSPSLLLNSSAVGSTNSFLWQDGSTNPTFLATTAGLYWVEARNASGCVKRDSITVAFRSSPNFNLGSDGPICEKDTITLNAAAPGAISYLWNNNTTAPTIRVFSAGIYWCEVNNGGCVFRDSVSITSIKLLPFINLGPDQTVCEGIPVSFDASYPNATYLWQNGTTNSLLTTTQPGSFWVQLDLNGCKKSDTVIVSRNLKPRFSLGPDQLICSGNSITLSPALNPSWQLSWPDGSSNPTFTINQPGNYSLAATNSCGTTTDAIVVSNGLCRVQVPTGFTPNNDGKNDLFRALGTEKVIEFHLMVFERSGRIIFETRDKNNGWDGKRAGLPFSSGVFVYLLQYKEQGAGESTYLKGTLTLIR
jgi:gliding motility-associated-like protein